MKGLQKLYARARGFLGVVGRRLPRPPRTLWTPVTFGLVNYRSPIRERIERVLLPTLRHYPEGVFEILVIDNEPEPQPGLREYTAALPVPSRYLWNEGRNLMISASKQQLYETARHPVVVYVCAAHGRMFDPTWLGDLVWPLRDPRVAMSGHRIRFKLHHIGAGAGEGWAIQGGVLAARREVLRRHPMPAEYPHITSDLWISHRLQQEGHRIADVHSILSIGVRRQPGRMGYKYIHDREQPRAAAGGGGTTRG